MYRFVDLEKKGQQIGLKAMYLTTATEAGERQLRQDRVYLLPGVGPVVQGTHL